MVSDPKEQEIRELLDRFWEGETSLEEERTLKEYFLYAKVSEDLQETAAYFISLRELPAEVLGVEFDDEVLSRIHASGGARVLQMNFFQSYWKQIAAAVVVLTVSAWYIWTGDHIAKEDKIYTAEGQVEDREIQEAFHETKKALFLLSGKFDRGNQQMKQLKKFDEATQQLKELNNE